MFKIEKENIIAQKAEMIRVKYGQEAYLEYVVNEYKKMLEEVEDEKESIKRKVSAR